MDRRLHDGPSCTTVSVVRDPVSKGISFFPKCSPTDTSAQPFWLSETLFLRVFHFIPSVSQLTHVKDCRLHDGPSYTTVLVVRDPVSKGLSLFLSVLQRTHVTDRHTHNGLSCTTVMTVRDPSAKGLHIFLMCPMTDTYDGPSYL